MVLSQIANAVGEHFISGNTENFMNTEEKKHMKILFIMAIWLVLVLTAGMWLWNNVAVKLTSILKPMTSIWQLLGLALLVDLIHPSCC